MPLKATVEWENYTTVSILQLRRTKYICKINGRNGVEVTYFFFESINQLAAKSLNTSTIPFIQN